MYVSLLLNEDTGLPLIRLAIPNGWNAFRTDTPAAFNSVDIVAFAQNCSLTAFLTAGSELRDNDRIRIIDLDTNMPSTTAGFSGLM